MLLDLFSADVTSVVSFHAIRMDDAGEAVHGCLVGDRVVNLSDCMRASISVLQLVAHLVGPFVL